MGCEYQVHVGVYVQIDEKNIGSILATEEVTGCPKCFNKTNDAFCSKCGAEVVTREIETQEKIHPADMEDEFDYRLYTINEHFAGHLWVANDRNDNSRCLCGEDAVMNLSVVNIEDIIDQFREDYSECIAVFDRIYGENNYQVNYGVIGYWS